MLETLDKICAALECQVGDLLVWKPNEEVGRKKR
ncbi:MAG: helix-turn-helix domain-containing protein [Chloroflexi bacterium]|nr:helix-turn-helix domain-containing protein [Chloroflexota bacterium]